MEDCILRFKVNMMDIYIASENTELPVVIEECIKFIYSLDNPPTLGIPLREKERLLHIHTPKQSLSRGIQTFLATRATLLSRGMNGGNDGVRVLRLQIRSPILRRRVVRSHGVDTGQGHAAGGALAPSA